MQRLEVVLKQKKRRGGDIGGGGGVFPAGGAGLSALFRGSGLA